MMRFLKMALLGAVIVAGTIAQAAAQAHATTTTTTAGGRIELFTPFTAKVRAPALVTGAIGGYGMFVSVDRQGHPDANGDFARFELKHGSFEIDGRTLISHLHPVARSFASCSAVLVGSGPVRVFDGTGAYRGIHGTLRATSRGGLLGPRDSSGKCVRSDRVPPLDVLGTLDMSGTVSFS